MTDEQLDDLKQFLTAIVSQSETRIKSKSSENIKKLHDELIEEIYGVRAEMREGFASIGDIVSGSNDRLDDHDLRITALESKAA